MPLPVPQKPSEIYTAEIALMLWTVWTCLYGIYDTQRSLGEIEQMLDQMSGILDIAPGTLITPNSLMKIALFGYGLIAVVSVYFVRKIDQGKEWARSSVLWSLILQVGIMIFPPYKQPLEYLADIPDIGLQLYALVKLYTSDCSLWFEYEMRDK